MPPRVVAPDTSDPAWDDWPRAADHGLSPTLEDAPRVRAPRPSGDHLLPPSRGLIVRRRWRRLRNGAAWTWGGLLFLLFCWGIWTISLRGSDLLGPMIALVVVCAVATLLFIVARLVGRAVLEQWLGRERLSAWPSHLTVCVFLVIAGIGFLQQTQWIMDGWRWLAEHWPLS